MRVLQALRWGSRNGRSAVWESGCAVICKDASRVARCLTKTKGQRYVVRAHFCGRTVPHTCTSEMASLTLGTQAMGRGF